MLNASPQKDFGKWACESKHLTLSNECYVYPSNYAIQLRLKFLKFFLDVEYPVGCNTHQKD